MECFHCRRTNGSRAGDKISPWLMHSLCKEVSGTQQGKAVPTTDVIASPCQGGRTSSPQPESSGLRRRFSWAFSGSLCPARLLPRILQHTHSRLPSAHVKIPSLLQVQATSLNGKSLLRPFSSLTSGTVQFQSYLIDTCYVRSKRFYFCHLRGRKTSKLCDRSLCVGSGDREAMLLAGKITGFVAPSW